MKHPGLENTVSICSTPYQTLQMRDELDMLIQKGSGTIAMGFGGNPRDTSAVRGGPAFEMLFNVHHYLKKKGLRDKFELVFFAPMAEPGKRMGGKSLEMMDMMFNRANIKTRVGTKIKTFEKNAVLFADDTRLDADLIMFIAAGDGHTVIKASDLPQNDAGFVKIDDYCQVTFDGDDEISNVYAVGDVAALDGPEWRAKQGHTAEVMARNAAFNIIARDEGRDDREGYQKHLNILCIMDSGNGAAFVYRDYKKAMMIPMPIIGHWMKKGWGWYARNSKLGKIPRLPGM
jgi:sulfide:quinone oxidoreductase